MAHANWAQTMRGMWSVRRVEALQTMGPGRWTRERVGSPVSSEAQQIAALPHDKNGKLNTTDAKRLVLEKLAEGWDVTDAARFVGRTRRGYEHWRKMDKPFAIEADIIFARRRDVTPEVCPDFPEFCERFLGQPLSLPHLRIWDVINKREPRELHESMKFNEGDPDRIIVNIPPEHQKSATWSINYVTWRLCQDLNYRCVIVSASLDMAKKFLYAVKQRLTNPKYAELQRRFGPPEGFKKAADSWTKTHIYLAGGDGTEKDPSVQALGVGGQIYGARADEIICDDIETLSNVAQWETHVDWLTQEVITRVGTGQHARVLVLGTRVAPVDFYQKLRDEFLDANGNPVWTYFSQPAVLEIHEDPEDWVTLLPTTQEDGVTRIAWDGPALAKRRNQVRTSTWALVYMQANIQTDAVFPEHEVMAAVQPMRRPGPIVPGHQHFHRPTGMQGLYVIAGIDPASVGYTAASVIGVDRRARKIWLLNQYNRKGILPRELRRLMFEWTAVFGVNEWRIETNAYQKSIIQDEEIRRFCHERGVILKGHTTNINKWDPTFGVASMSTLFETQGDGLPQILLPCANASFPAVASLVDQLLTWQPDAKNQVTDCIMSLWFTIIRARELLRMVPDKQTNHMPSQFLSRNRARNEQHIIDLEELTQQHFLEGYQNGS